MPGVLLIYGFVALAILVSLLAGRWYTRDPSRQDPGEDFRRLQRHAAWLEDRLDQARRERWGSQMIASLERQLGSACQQLARTQRRAAERRVARRT